MATDPYAAPGARVADRPEAGAEGVFLPEGRAVAAIQGWNWVVEGWRLFAREPLVWVLISLLFAAITFVLAVIPIIGQLGLIVVFPVFVAGYMLGCRALERDEKLGVPHLFAGFQTRTGPLVVLGFLALASVVVLAIVVVGIFWSTLLGVARATGSDNLAGLMAIAGTVMLIGLVFLALSLPLYMAFWFAPALVALNGLDAADALKASFRVCLRNVVPFLLYGAVTFVLSVFAGLTYGLGWIVLGPVLAGSVYAGYRDIFYAR